MARRKLWFDLNAWWFNRFSQRPGWWFGGPFWIGALLVMVVFPTLELFFLCNGELSSGAGLALAIVDMIAVLTFLMLASAFSHFGTTFFTNTGSVIMFFRRVGLVDRYRLQERAATYLNMKAESQKSSVVAELVAAPYTFRIFSRYILRVSVAVFAIPIYFGLSMVSLRIIPEDHLADGQPIEFEALQLLQVLRDLQTSFLGGSSTEHHPHLKEMERGQGGDDQEMAVAKGDEDSTVGGQSVGHPAISPRWWEVLWETLGIFLAGLYVLVVLVLFPVQITILGSMERFFKRRSFWVEHLMAVNAFDSSDKIS